MLRIIFLFSVIFIFTNGLFSQSLKGYTLGEKCHNKTFNFDTKIAGYNSKMHVHTDDQNTIYMLRFFVVKETDTHFIPIKEKLELNYDIVFDVEYSSDKSVKLTAKKDDIVFNYTVSTLTEKQIFGDKYFTFHTAKFEMISLSCKKKAIESEF